MAENPTVDQLFRPRGVAVIGASRSPGKIGHKIVENLLLGGYRGELYLVNPSGGVLMDHPIYPSMGDIEGPVDLAIVAIPAKYVFEAVRECSSRGVKYAAIITSGFSEVGNLQEERDIVAHAHDHGMRIVGPNIFGVYSSAVSMNATFGPGDIEPGHVAMVTQSGALGIAIMGRTRSENIGVSAVVSVGNKSDVDEADLLEYLSEDPATRVIFMYMEGVRNGQRLLDVLRDTTRRKPVIVIKSGRSRRGAMAAASHTGSLAGADEIFSDVMAQAGVLRAETIQEALDRCKFLSTTPRPKGPNSVIITNGGGIGVMAADASEKHDVHLYDNVTTLADIFSDSVPAFGSTKNPVDITGQGTSEDYRRALTAATSSEAIHSIVCLGCETGVLDPAALETTLQGSYDEAAGKKPIVYSFLGGPAFQRAVEGLGRRGVPVFADVYDAVACLGAVYAHERMSTTPIGQLAQPDVPRAELAQIVRSARAAGRTFLLAHEGQALLHAAGIPTPQGSVARSLEQAVVIAEGITYPVVMKVVSKDILHKSDVGGVALGLDNAREVMEAYEAIMQRCRQAAPLAKIDGIEVSEMVPPGLETIVGARRDAAFGPVVMFGLGGIYVEVMKDVSFRAYPLSESDALTMVKEIRAYPLLLGVRGEDPKDIGAVVDTILRIGAVLDACPAISDIEVNPLIAYEVGEGTKAVDIRVILSDQGSSADE